MVLDPRKRQKKLERRNAKQKANKKVLAQRNSLTPTVLFERAIAAPVLHSCTTQSLWDQGIGTVLLSRETNTGRVAFATFLVDVFCLGVKNASFGLVPRAQYDREIYDRLVSNQRVEKRTPAYLRKLVEGAVAYTLDLGLHPHSDYLVAKLIFGDIDAGQCSETLSYGRDGKPFFVAGPYDNVARCLRIINLLTLRCGEDGFDYLAPLATGGPRLA